MREDKRQNHAGGCRAVMQRPWLAVSSSVETSVAWLTEVRSLVERLRLGVCAMDSEIRAEHQARLVLAEIELRNRDMNVLVIHGRDADYCGW